MARTRRTAAKDDDEIEYIDDEVYPKPTKQSKSLIKKVVNKFTSVYPELKEYKKEMESIAVALVTYFLTTIGVKYLQRKCVNSDSFICNFREAIAFVRNQINLDNFYKIFVNIEDRLLSILQKIFSVIGLDKLFPVMATFIKGTLEKYFRKEEQSADSFSLSNFFGFGNKTPQKQVENK